MTTRTSSLALAALLLLPLTLPAQSAQWYKDNQTETKVQKALTDFGIVGSSIFSSVEDNIVKLSGNVRSEEERQLAADRVSRIDTVKTVVNNLVVVRNLPAPVQAKSITLPAGTTLPVRLNGGIDTKTAKAGDTFQGSIAAAVLSGGTVALPTGTPVTGRVVAAKAAGRLSGAAELSLELVSVQVANGQPVALATRELSSKNTGRGTNTAARTGGGAALGAIIGGIAGGGAGAGIGAASGGALGVGSNVLRPGQQIVLSSEALLQFQTASNLDLTPQGNTANGVSHGVGLAAHTDATPKNQGQSIPGQQDPYHFDIVGLRLGMTAQQAAAALTAKVPQATSLPPTKGVPQFTPNIKFTSTVLANGPNFNILMNFVESYPLDPQRPEQLAGIFYTANLPTAADRERFEQAVLAKYGPPVRYTKSIGAGWCNVGTLTGPNQYVCAPDVPNLVFKTTELILGDNGIAARERAEWNRQSSTTPPL